jgi:hypothetical protein
MALLQDDVKFLEAGRWKLEGGSRPLAADRWQLE